MTPTSELETNLMAVAGQLLDLALRVADVANDGNPQRAEAEALYRDRRLNLLLQIGAEHGGDGLTAVRLDLTDPKNGMRVVKLIEIIAKAEALH